jgi:hypothetical protein
MVVGWVFLHPQLNAVSLCNYLLSFKSKSFAHHRCQKKSEEKK